MMDGPLLQELTPRIHLNESDFSVITNNGELCDEKGRIGPRAFEQAMRKQLRLYAQRQLADTLMDDTLESADMAQLATLKILLIDESQSSTSVSAARNDISLPLSGQILELHKAVLRIQDNILSLQRQVASSDTVQSFETLTPPHACNMNLSQPKLEVKVNLGQSSNLHSENFQDAVYPESQSSPVDLHSFCYKLIQPICAELVELRKAMFSTVMRKQKFVNGTNAANEAKQSRNPTSSRKERPAALDISPSLSCGESTSCEEHTIQPQPDLAKSSFGLGDVAYSKSSIPSLLDFCSQETLSQERPSRPSQIHYDSNSSEPVCHTLDERFHMEAQLAALRDKSDSSQGQGTVLRLQARTQPVTLCCRHLEMQGAPGAGKLMGSQSPDSDEVARS